MRYKHYFVLMLSLVSIGCTMRQLAVGDSVATSECNRIFRNSCVSCHSVLRTDVEGFIARKDMLKDGHDSFLSKLARAQKTHHIALADSIELMKTCSWVYFCD